MKKAKFRERLIEKITHLIELACQECDVDYPQFYYTCVGRCMEIVAVGDSISIKTVVPDDPKKWGRNFVVNCRGITVVGDPNLLIDRLQNVKDRTRQDCGG